MTVHHLISIIYPIFFIHECKLEEISEANFSITLNRDYDSKVKVDLCKISLNNTVACSGEEYEEDLEESGAFVKEYLLRSKNGSAGKAMACGTGIDRVNVYILDKMFTRVDTIELNLNTIPAEDHEDLRLLYRVGLKLFQPEETYDLIWFQWVLKYLEHDDAVNLLIKCRKALNSNGTIIIRDDVRDNPIDAVIRTYQEFVDVQNAAALKVVKQDCSHKNGDRHVHTFLLTPMDDEEWIKYQAYMNASGKACSEMIILWSVSGVLINMVGQGMALSYPSVLMPALKSADAEIRTSLQTASWIASSIGVGGVPGVLLASYFMGRYGRRITHGLVIIPGIVGWLLIYFASGTTALLIGRLLCGLTAGASVGLGAVVIGEYSSPTHRGMFLNLKTTAVCLGGLIVHILNNFYTWRTIALISLIPYFISLLIIATWPESPAWLAGNGEFEKSEKAFYWLRGRTEQTNKELRHMIQAHTELKQNDNISFGEKIKVFFNKFTRKDFITPVFITLLGSVLLEVSGRHIFPAFALDIMGEITGSKKQSFYFTLALDLIILTSVSFSSILVRMMRRRSLLFSTGFAAVTVVLAACLYLFLVAKEVISKDYPWIAVGLFIVFFVLVNFGCAPIPLAFLGELLPLAHRGVGTAVAGIGMSLVLNIALQLTPFLLVYCKVYGTFTVFGLTIAVLLLVLYYILPETKDRTLQEIEDYFNNGKFKDTTDEAEYKMIPDKEIRLP